MRSPPIARFEARSQRFFLEGRRALREAETRDADEARGRNRHRFGRRRRTRRRRCIRRRARRQHDRKRRAPASAACGFPTSSVSVSGALTAVRGVATGRRIRAPASLACANEAAARTRLPAIGRWRASSTEVPFPTYPDGFPPEVVEAFTRDRRAAAARQHDGVGDRDHRRARPGASGDRPPDPLYVGGFGLPGRGPRGRRAACDPLRLVRAGARDARPPHNVNRVIARPFVGEPGAFQRTPNRRDYAIEPPPNLLDRAGGPRVSRCTPWGRSATSTAARRSPHRFESATIVTRWRKRSICLARVDRGFIFTNLNDFDSKFGHRRDVRGYAHALEELDSMLPRSNRGCVTATK